jgi:hypothetical protein
VTEEQEHHHHPLGDPLGQEADALINPEEAVEVPCPGLQRGAEALLRRGKKMVELSDMAVPPPRRASRAVETCSSQPAARVLGHLGGSLAAPWELASIYGEHRP